MYRDHCSRRLATRSKAGKAQLHGLGPHVEPDWHRYQREVANFFQDLGLDAKVDATLRGVRTEHDIDVLVESTHKGISLRWVVECKSWKRSVTKVSVLALRTIVDDVGADRGFLMSERGYQKGAREAAFLSNIELTSLRDLRETCAQELAMMRARKLYVSALDFGNRYWELSKDTRIRHGLRGDLYEYPTYSGDHVVKAAKAALLAAMFHGFPVIYNEFAAATGTFDGRTASRFGDVTFNNPTELADYISEKLEKLEALLRKAEADTGT